MGMLAADTLPILSTLKYSWSAESPALPARFRIMVLLAWCGMISSMLSSSVRPGSSGSGSAPSSPSICPRYRWTSAFTSGPYTVMSPSNSEFGQMIEFTSLCGPLA